jgi:hypothetical protein
MRFRASWFGVPHTRDTRWLLGWPEALPYRQYVCGDEFWRLFCALWAKFHADSVGLRAESGKDGGRGDVATELRSSPKSDYFTLLTEMVSSFMVPLIVTCLPAIDVTLA